LSSTSDPAQSGTGQNRADALLACERPFEGRRLGSRERVAETALAALTAVAALLLLAFGPPVGWRQAGWLAVAAILYGACARVKVYVGGGYATPTQAVLIAMLLALPAWDVPAVIMFALASTTVVEIAARQERPERLLTRIADSAYALAPALVLIIAGTTARHAGPPVLALAVGAQFLADGLLSSGREWLGRGIHPRECLDVMVLVFTLDLLLTPVGIVAESPGSPHVLGAVAIAAVVALLAALSRDRSRRLRDASDRYDRLQRERERTRSAIQILHATVQAVDAHGGRIEVDATTTEPRVSAALDQIPPGSGAASHRIEVAIRRVGEEDGQLGTVLVARDAPFSGHERELVEHFAAHAAVSLENYSLFERVRLQATHDRLTGLLNRAVFDDALARESVRATRNGGWLGLVLLDIDHFKSFNDTYGHHVGDLVLRAVADAVRSHARSCDVAARYGGEELAVLVPGTDSEGCMALAERIRVAVSDTEVVHEGTRLSVTASLGAAAAGPAGLEPELLVLAADDALYAAKRGGRNRCQLAGSDPATAPVLS
jgi:diguanylate cyclase (GGDEF)-like protein